MEKHIAAFVSMAYYWFIFQTPISLNFSKAYVCFDTWLFPRNTRVYDAVRINHERMTYEKGERLVED